MKLSKQRDKLIEDLVRVAENYGTSKELLDVDRIITIVDLKNARERLARSIARLEAKVVRK